MYKTPKLETIEILGVTVRIEIDHYRLENEEQCDGMYNNKIIYLKKHYSDKDHYKRIFLHECMHALCDIQGYQLDDHLEESIVNTMSYLSVELLK